MSIGVTLSLLTDFPRPTASPDRLAAEVATVSAISPSLISITVRGGPQLVIFEFTSALDGSQQTALTDCTATHVAKPLVEGSPLTIDSMILDKNGNPLADKNGNLLTIKGP